MIKAGIIIKKIKAKNRNIRATFNYILNRAGRGRKTHKVEYSGSVNFLYDDINKQIKEIEQRHKKYILCGGTVTPDMHLVLSYPTNFIMSEDEYRKDVLALLRHLGMEDNACLWAVHSNTKNTHIHLYVDRINPSTVTFDTSRGTCFETTTAGTVRRHESNCFQAACYELSMKYGYPTKQYRVDDKGNPQNYVKSQFTRVNPKDKKAVAISSKSNTIIQEFLAKEDRKWSDLLSMFGEQNLEYRAVASKDGTTRGAVIMDTYSDYKIKSSILPIGHKEIEKEIGRFTLEPSPALSRHQKKEKKIDPIKKYAKEHIKNCITRSTSWIDFQEFLEQHNYYMEQRGASFTIVYGKYKGKIESIAPSKIDRAYTYVNLKAIWGDPPQGTFRAFTPQPKANTPKTKIESTYKGTSTKSQQEFCLKLKNPQSSYTRDYQISDKVRNSIKSRTLSKVFAGEIVEFKQGFTLKVTNKKIVLASYKNEEELNLAILAMIEIGRAMGWKLENMEFNGSMFFKERAYEVLRKTLAREQESREENELSIDIGY